MVVWLKPCESRSSPGALPETLSPTGLRVSFCLQFGQRQDIGEKMAVGDALGPSALILTRLGHACVVVGDQGLQLTALRRGCLDRPFLSPLC